MAVITTVLYDVIARDNASRTFGRVGDSAYAAESKTARFGRALSTVGIALTGTAIVVGTQAVRMATQFQASMTKIQTQAGASAMDVTKLSKAVLQLSATHAEQGPQVLADSLYHLKSVGLDNVKAMVALRTASDLAAVGGASLEEATSALAGAWRSGIKGAHNFGQAAGTVNAIIGAGNMRMTDFLDALSSGILPAARTFGVSLKSVGAALALMTDEGIPAQLAATRLRMTLSLMGAPSSKAVAALQSIGMQQGTLARDMRNPKLGLVGAIADLKRHLDDSGLSAVKQAQVISHAFGGGRSSAAIMTLLNNINVLQRKQVQIGATASKFASDVQAQRQTAQAQLDMLKAQTDTLLIKLGVDLLPLLVKAAKWVNTSLLPGIEKFVHWLGSPDVKPWSKFFAGLAGAAVAAELIRRALSKVGDLTGLSRVLNSTARSSTAGTLGSASVNMGTAADTMFQASLNMLKAAGLEADAAVGQTAAGGAAGTAGKVGAGALLGRFLGGLVSKAFIATLITEFAVKPLLAGLKSGPGGKNWWDNPFGQDKRGPNAGPLASWPGLGRAMFGGGGTMFHGPSGTPMLLGRQPGWLTGDISGPTSRVWDSAYQNFMRGFASPLTHWFTSTLPQFFTGTVPHFLVGTLGKLAFQAISGIQGGLTRSARSAQNMWHNWIVKPFVGAGRWLVGFGKDVVGGLGFGVLSAWRVIKGAFGTVKGWVTGAFHGALNWLWSAGRFVMWGLLNGIISIAKGIGSWVKAHIVDPVVGAVKSFFGIHSPSAVMAGLGSHLMTGLFAGIMQHDPLAFVRKVFGSMPNALAAIASKGFVSLASLPMKALNALGHAGSSLLHGLGSLLGFGGGGGAGVGKYTPLILTALKLLGQPASALGTVLSQMMTESGGNTQAVNRTDSNWFAGHPSVGLMQVIRGTFASWAGPFRGVGPFLYGVSTNALANIYAGLNYAIHRYGRTGWMSVLGHGHGYWQGGPITEPIFGVGRSGRTYTFGEGGLRERVVRDGGSSVNGGLTSGPLVHVDQMVVQDATDAELVARKLAFRIMATSFGGNG